MGPAPQDATDPVGPDSWTSIDARCLNGEQQAIVWDETEVQMSQSQGSDQLGATLEDNPEDIEQWEQITWPAMVRPMTCASPPLSFATVQWDAADPGPDFCELETDGGLATELDPYATPLSLHQAEDVCAVQEIKEEEDGFDIKPLKVSQERTGSSPEVRTVCCGHAVLHLFGIVTESVVGYGFLCVNPFLQQPPGALSLLQPRV